MITKKEGIINCQMCNNTVVSLYPGSQEMSLQVSILGKKVQELQCIV